jgi:hypothetical protein
MPSASAARISHRPQRSHDTSSGKKSRKRSFITPPAPQPQITVSHEIMNQFEPYVRPVNFNREVLYGAVQQIADAHCHRISQVSAEDVVIAFRGQHLVSGIPDIAQQVYENVPVWVVLVRLKGEEPVAIRVDEIRNLAKMNCQKEKTP